MGLGQAVGWGQRGRVSVSKENRYVSEEKKRPAGAIIRARGDLKLKKEKNYTKKSKLEPQTKLMEIPINTMVWAC